MSESPTNICFRCDGNLQIGSGHLVRCLTLAKALRNKGATCSFVCREHSRDMAERITREGFEVTFLPEKVVLAGNPNEPVLAHAAWLGTDWQTDADQTIAALSDTKPDWLIVDHYALDYRWEGKLRSHCQRVMAIDDLADRRHDCDLLLDQNLVANMESRYDGLLPQQTVCLIGPSWALLQPEYAELHPRTPPRIGSVKHIFVYFGGADHYNLTGRAIGAFLALGREDVQLSVVINPSGIHADAIRVQVAPYANITLYGALPGLAPLMLQADLAIGAVGATSWERCCLGLPTLGITLAENQRPIAEALHREGYITWLGDWGKVSEAMLTEQLLQWMDEKNIEEVSLQCKSLVDGKGVERVVSTLLLSHYSTIKIQKAQLSHELLLSPWYSRESFYEKLRQIEVNELFIITTTSDLFLGHVSLDQDAEGLWRIDYGLTGVAANDEQIKYKILGAALLEFRQTRKGTLRFKQLDKGEPDTLAITVCSDGGSWINNYIPELLLDWINEGHIVTWAHNAKNLPVGDLCFYLSYGKIVDGTTLAKYKNNLVVHESDLPQGKGWSPLTWQILEGENNIPVTLIEADQEVDSGLIYEQQWIRFRGDELVDELREKQAEVTVKLCSAFVLGYPQTASKGKKQAGVESFYPRRNPKDSRLDPEKSIIEQFNQFRVVDNDKYPAFVDILGFEYLIRIEKR